MRLAGFGDMALAYRNAVQHARLKGDLARLGEELASGKKSDLREATGGDFTGFAAIEASLKTLSAYKGATQEAALFAETVQLSLGHMHDLATDLAPKLMTAGNTQNADTVDVIAEEARTQFEAALSMLNARVAGRAVLSGTATDRTPIADSATILANLGVAVAAETTASGVEAAVDAWFDDPGGGFETIAYQGGTDDLAPFRVGEGETLSLQMRADDQEIRDVLKGFALAAVMAGGALAGSGTQRAILAGRAGERLLNASNTLTALRAEVGAVEGQAEAAMVRNAAETAALEATRSAIIQADPYQTATELQTAQTQLETLYTITARLSRLNLVEYLR